MASIVLDNNADCRPVGLELAIFVSFASRAAGVCSRAMKYPHFK